MPPSGDSRLITCNGFIKSFPNGVDDFIDNLQDRYPGARVEVVYDVSGNTIPGLVAVYYNGNYHNGNNGFGKWNPDSKYLPHSYRLGLQVKATQELRIPLSQKMPQNNGMAFYFVALGGLALIIVIIIFALFALTPTL